MQAELLSLLGTDTKWTPVRKTKIILH